MSPLQQLVIWLSDAGAGFFSTYGFCFIRTGAVFALVPVFGEQILPMRIRLGGALAMTLVVTPAVGFSAVLSPANFLSEAVTGLMIGAGLRVFLSVLQTVGMMAAQAASLSQIFTGAGAEAHSGFSNLLILSGLALLCTTGFPSELAHMLVLSYDILPAGQWPLASESARWHLLGISSAFELAFSLAAPFLIAALIYNAAIGSINKAMPALMVAMIGAPALTLGALALLAVTAPLLLALWLSEFQVWMMNPFAAALP